MAPWQSISNGKGRSSVFLHHLLTIARASIYFTFSKTRVLTLIFPSLDLGEGGVVSIILSPSLLSSRQMCSARYTPSRCETSQPAVDRSSSRGFPVLASCP